MSVIVSPKTSQARSKVHRADADSGKSRWLARDGDYLERPDSVSHGREWLGLVEANHSFHLYPTRVSVIRDSEIVDRWLLTIHADDIRMRGKPSFLFSGFKRLKEGVVEYALHYGDDLSPGGEIQLELRNGSRYRLRVERPISDSDTTSLLISSGRRHQRLEYSASPDPDGDRSSIEWAGDLDHDGRLDLLIHRSSSREGVTTLYLSSDAQDESMLMKESAQWCVTEGE